MIIVCKRGATSRQLGRIVKSIENWGLKAHVSRGTERTIIGIIGPEDAAREKPLAAFEGVESVLPVLKPYRLVSYEFKRMRSVVRIGSGRRAVAIGGDNIPVMAGPCSVESREQIIEIARLVKKGGAKMLRGGAFKPRTSPYAFQGLGEEGLKYMAEAREVTGLPIITEVMDPRDLKVIERYADCLQVGARNMQNFSLLKEVGKSKLPVMLKRGMSATIKDLLMSAEYILSEGNFNVLLCERGIRTFETYTRNTLDLNAVPCLRKETHLPIVVDPTHGIGLHDQIPAMALAAVAAGADALMLEVHNQPAAALSDGDQSLQPAEFSDLMKRIRAVAKAVGREA